MSGLAITIESKSLEDAIRKADELGDVLQSHELRMIAGRAVQQAIFLHLSEISRDAAHHQTASSLGADRTGFYEEAAKAVESPSAVRPEADGVSISIDHQGIAQRYFGGTITKLDGWLALPAIAEVYGQRARDVFDSLNLHFVIFKDTGLAALLFKDRAQDEGSVAYWLVHSVTQAPDPTVLPTPQEMLDPAIEAVNLQLETVWGRKAA